MATFGFSIDTAANWKANNPTPNADEMCLESDTRFVKVGDGATAYNSLSYLVTDAAVGGIYGDGSDGNVTISGTTQLARDMFYDTLTVTGTLIVNCFRVFCKTACVVSAGGTIQNNGASATSSASAAALSAQVLGVGSSGGTGGTTTGTAGAVRGNAAGGAGGLGGNGSSGTGAAAGSIVAVVANIGGWRFAPASVIGGVLGPAQGTIAALNGGSGGGGGGGDGTAGGGGGAGGNALVLTARSITNSGTISANGGNGFTPTAGNRGGGGGGGGGIVILNAASFSGTTPVATGGAGGSGTGTGTAGASGSAGTVLVNVWA